MIIERYTETDTQDDNELRVIIGPSGIPSHIFESRTVKAQSSVAIPGTSTYKTTWDIPDEGAYYLKYKDAYGKTIKEYYLVEKNEDSPGLVATEVDVTTVISFARKRQSDTRKRRQEEYQKRRERNRQYFKQWDVEDNII